MLMGWRGRGDRRRGFDAETLALAMSAVLFVMQV